MSIGGIDGGTAGLYGPGTILDRTRPEDRPEGGSTTGVGESTVTRLRADEANLSARAQEAGGTPDGVDPALWSVLTTEERNFFMKAKDLGPITYRPGRSNAEAAPQRGGRVDVRV